MSRKMTESIAVVGMDNPLRSVARLRGDGLANRVSPAQTQAHRQRAITIGRSLLDPGSRVAERCSPYHARLCTRTTDDADLIAWSGATCPVHALSSPMTRPSP